MSAALCNLVSYRSLYPDKWFDIVLSIHDAIMFEVTGDLVPYLVDEVIPMCMTEGVEVPGLGLKYGIGKPELMIRWSEHADTQELLDIGVPRSWLEEFTSNN